MRLASALLFALFWTSGSALGWTPASGTTTTTKPANAPPYYRDGRAAKAFAAAASARPIAALPVVLTLPEGMPPGWLPLAELELLREEMNEWLAADAALAGRPLVEIAGPGAAAPHAALGCVLDFASECSQDEPANVLSTTTANRAWRELVATELEALGAGGAVVLELQVAQHWIRQRGIRGHKEIRLGTGHTQPLPWLTSLDTPVWVLQVAGVLVDAEGQIVRSGAEGIWAVRTPFRASALGAQKLLESAEVEEVRTGLHRQDLAGAPLAWQAALDQLLRTLLAGATS
ncbi:MAG: hypothetical protein DWQ36_15275 [Acidobacteria bacterium]|nr:MAG: hypothetical protein DWQ36_15275 [Acidobacteriota bacterium]